MHLNSMEVAVVVGCVDSATATAAKRVHLMDGKGCLGDSWALLLRSAMVRGLLASVRLHRHGHCRRFGGENGGCAGMSAGSLWPLPIALGTGGAMVGRAGGALEEVRVQCFGPQTMISARFRPIVSGVEGASAAKLAPQQP